MKILTNKQIKKKRNSLLKSLTPENDLYFLFINELIETLKHTQAENNRLNEYVGYADHIQGLIQENTLLKSELKDRDNTISLLCETVNGFKTGYHREKEENIRLLEFIAFIDNIVNSDMDDQTWKTFRPIRKQLDKLLNREGSSQETVIKNKE